MLNIHSSTVYSSTLNPFFAKDRKSVRLEDKYRHFYVLKAFFFNENPSIHANINSPLFKAERENDCFVCRTTSDININQRGQIGLRFQ